MEDGGCSEGERRRLCGTEGDSEKVITREAEAMRGLRLRCMKEEAQNHIKRQYMAFSHLNQNNPYMIS